jgi:hypothetical protein
MSERLRGGPPTKGGEGVEEGERLGYLEFVQTIYPTTLTPRQYLEQQAEKQVKRPENCANCCGANCLEALGYYDRYISHLLEYLRIRVRRFLCLCCRVSISYLPDFAQPYRVVNSQTVEAGFNGGRAPPEVHWGSLIAVYWKKFTLFLRGLLGIVGNAFGPCAVQVRPKDFWSLILKECGSLAAATEQLVRRFRVCLFGRYRCHQRKGFAK